MYQLNTDIVPLCEDLELVVPCEFLTSTSFKRWCVLNKLSDIWNNCLTHAKRSVSLNDFDRSFEHTALFVLINLLYENNTKETVVRFVYNLLYEYKCWDKGTIEVDEICKDLEIIGVAEDSLAMIRQLGTVQEERITEESHMTREELIRAKEEKYKKLCESEPNSSDGIKAYFDWYNTTLMYLSDSCVSGTPDFDKLKSLDNSGNGYTLRDNYKYIQGIYNILLKEANKQTGVSKTAHDKAPKVFISHSTADKEFVIALVDLLEAIGLRKDNLFCSSIAGYNIPLGKNIYEYIKAQFKKNETFVIFVQTPNYYKSPVCLNEMGAAWILQSDYCSILSKEMSFEDMKGVVNSAEIAIKVDNDEAPERLNELKNKLITLLGLHPLDETIWERKRRTFLRQVNKA